MKVSIMSMQRIANYGSFLQAYALKKTIETLGHQVDFADYRVQPCLIQPQKVEYKSRYLPILCSLIVIAATTKRTGMLAASIGFAVFYLTDGKSKKPIKKRLERIVKITILGLIVIAFLVLVLSRFGIDVLGRFSELSSDGGSGRNIVWAKVLASFSNSDLKRKIFGHGINSVFQTVTIYSDVRIKAHNDFIETLHDYGYFGLFLLIAFIAMLFKEQYKKQIKYIHSREKIVQEYLMGNLTAYLWSTLVKRALYNELRFEQLKIGEDALMLCRLYCRAEKLVVFQSNGTRSWICYGLQHV